jgi:hypothetical protein
MIMGGPLDILDPRHGGEEVRGVGDEVDIPGYERWSSVDLVSLFVCAACELLA